jgi:hypothetical protein
LPVVLSKLWPTKGCDADPDWSALPDKPENPYGDGALAALPWVDLELAPKSAFQQQVLSDSMITFAMATIFLTLADPRPDLRVCWTVIESGMDVSEYKSYFDIEGVKTILGVIKTAAGVRRAFTINVAARHVAVYGGKDGDARASRSFERRIHRLTNRGSRLWQGCFASRSAPHTRFIAGPMTSPSPSSLTPLPNPTCPRRGTNSRLT